MEKEAAGGENSHTLAAEFPCTDRAMWGEARPASGDTTPLAFQITAAVAARTSSSKFRANSIRLRARRVSQFRCNLVCLLELHARLYLLSFLMKSQGEVVVRFSIARLEADRIEELHLGFAGVACLQ